MQDGMGLGEEKPIFRLGGSAATGRNYHITKHLLTRQFFLKSDIGIEFL